MAHREEQQFCESVRTRFPRYFNKKFVLDIGSLDINGNNGYLFDDCLYIGVDIAEGKNVDIVSKGHELTLPGDSFDTIISTECFEHDQYYFMTINNLIRLLKPGGLLLFTCATTGRPEHGTRRSTIEDAPLLLNFGEWSDYYKNLDESDIRAVFKPEIVFSEFEFSTNSRTHDLYFWGIKAGAFVERDNYSFLVNKINNDLRILRQEIVDLKNEPLTFQSENVNMQVELGNIQRRWVFKFLSYIKGMERNLRHKIRK
jgi:SAM-dependent methyltransferase